MTSPPTEPDFLRASGPEPHAQRTKEMLKKYPQVRKLFGRNIWTAPLTLGIVAGQFGVAYFVHDKPWWVWLPAAWLVGAFFIHALFVVIHEATHNLVFRRSWQNKACGIFANLPSVAPSAIAFRNLHLLHHRFQGEFGWDADLPGQNEARWVGNSTPRKIAWMLGFAFVEGFIRPRRVDKVNLVEKWALWNLLACTIATVTVTVLWGWAALGYLVASTLFAVGLHPVGARWIQEHYVFKDDQETYSYYGPLNYLALNVGHHNEHHDFMTIPWHRLPKLRAMAPEYYDTLMYHQSWSKLLLRFLFDPSVTLYDRVVRPDHDPTRRRRLTSRDTQAIQNTAIPKTEAAEEAMA